VFRITLRTSEELTHREFTLAAVPVQGMDETGQTKTVDQSNSMFSVPKNEPSAHVSTADFLQSLDSAKSTIHSYDVDSSSNAWLKSECGQEFLQSVCDSTGWVKHLTEDKPRENTDGWSDVGAFLESLKTGEEETKSDEIPQEANKAQDFIEASLGHKL